MNWKWGAVLLVVLVDALAVGSWFLMKRSDAYLLAESFVRQNTVVASRIGPIEELSLKPFGYSLRLGAARGANFEFAVRGKTKEGEVSVELVKDGIWQVRVARLVLPDQPAVELR